MHLLSPPVRLAGFLRLAAALSLTQITFAADPPPAEPSKANSGSERSALADAKTDAVANSVVKVFSTVRYPDFYKPWTKEAPVEISGSGVIIEGKRILSNAHVVLYASQVQVQANQAGDKFSATVEALAPGIDLAVLKLDDESFFNAHPPLPRASALPEVKDAVMAYGYPQGGTSLSITRGIVSRIEFALYNFPVAGLRVQIDAAINPGNSGGPAVVGNQMIGLTFSHLSNSENIGYIIPNEEIELFLKDIADGHYDGKPAMFDLDQTLENPALRRFLKLDKSVEGSVVHQPFSTDAGYPLKEWDVITRIAGTPVDNQGRVKLNANLRVYFKYLIQKNAKNGKVPLTIVRAGKELQVELPVSSRRPLVIPSLDGAYPSYFVYGPLVFSTATREMIGGLTGGARGGALLARLAAVGSPLFKRFSDPPAFADEGLVIVSSPFFPHKLVNGYDNPILQVVKNINGHPIKNLTELVSYLRDCKDEFITIEFDLRGAETLVFPRAEMLTATDEILADNGLRSQGSADTLAIWNAGKSK
jgi:S1-C subfamily serine protease